MTTVSRIYDPAEVADLRQRERRTKLTLAARRIGKGAAVASIIAAVSVSTTLTSVAGMIAYSLFVLLVVIQGSHLAKKWWS